MNTFTHNATASNTGMSRRDFLKTGTGLAIGFIVGPGLLMQAVDANAAGGAQINAWVNIATDGTVSIMLPSS